VIPAKARREDGFCRGVSRYARLRIGEEKMDYTTEARSLDFLNPLTTNRSLLTGGGLITMEDLAR